jgi:succinoglycan biosynthesis protein ExoL
MKILFVLPVASQPRFAKRIRKFISRGDDVTVASFERDYFRLNKLPSGIEFHSLGKIQSRDYLKRIPKLISALQKLLPLIGKNEVIYIFSVDVLTLLFPFLRGKKIYYEIGDIRELGGGKLLTTIFDQVYCKFLQKCDRILVTSEEFKTYLSEKYILEDKRISTIENRLDGVFFDSFEKTTFKPRIEPGFNLGIIGLFRYQNILEFLKAYKDLKPGFKISFYGDGPLAEEIKKYVDGVNVFYFGQFKNPDDLLGIYEKIDISFTMYDAADLNVRLALPNKLYESMYFKKPIIVSSGTYLERKVKEFGIGFSWDQKDMPDLVRYLDSNVFLEKYQSMEKDFDKIIKTDFLE